MANDVIDMLKRRKTKDLDGRTLVILKEFAEAYLREQERLRKTVPPSMMGWWDRDFAKQVAETKKCLEKITKALRRRESDARYPRKPPSH